MKVKVTSPSFSKKEELRGALLGEFPDSIFNDEGKKFSPAEIVDYLSDADFAIVGTDKVSRETLSKLPNLKMISKYGVGLDNLDVEACKEFGIKVGWTGGVNKLSVAEMTLGFMISLCRNLYLTSSHLSNGEWVKDGGFQLSGKKIGIIGYGFVGREVHRLLKPFNCEIYVNDIIDVIEDGITIASKESIFEECDIVTIHVPKTKETTNLVGKTELQKMKKTSFVINTARGGIINEKALAEALREGTIAGAAIDVYDEEPVVSEELVKLKNLFCTPHIGGNSNEAVLSMGESAIAHLREEKNK